MPNFMTIPGDSEDARAVRTRQHLGDALIGLMHTRAFDEITVQDICDAAAVGRSTFYEHFEDKEEMFIRHTVAFARGIGGTLAFDAARRTYLLPVRGFLAHLRQMQPLFQSLASAGKLDFMFKVWHNNIAEVFTDRIRALRAERVELFDIPAEILAQQLSGTLMTLANWWRDHHYPKSAEEMEKLWERMVAGLV